MRKLVLLAAASATLVFASAASAKTFIYELSDADIANLNTFVVPTCTVYNIVQPDVHGGFIYSCTGPATLFELLKAKAVCSIIFHGTLSTLPAVGPSIVLFRNNGYACSFLPTGGFFT